MAWRAGGSDCGRPDARTDRRGPQKFGPPSLGQQPYGAPSASALRRRRPKKLTRQMSCGRARCSQPLKPKRHRMLRRLPEDVAEALARAAAADERASGASDPTIRADQERIATCWRNLAASYQFAHTLKQYLLDADAQKRHLPPPEPPDLAPEDGNGAGPARRLSKLH